MTESGNNIRGGVLTGLAIVNIPLLRVFLCRRVERRSGRIRCQCAHVSDTRVYPISGSEPVCVCE
jgi:hypothetical protein